ncbi:MAG: hypothetical protein PQJ61_07120 [Spirochaetales bacterium]|uniref:Uncharacterized protein n=1 Tax=Candidatus Thalassospirochaeta sargassi TaxID=3119039 RepID=A0AAJ1MNL2_9SPIO|nr:hypothetical protein [Spirochaetales bacterium]
MILRIPWLLLSAANFIIQLLYFYRDSSTGLFRAKKITTPLLLFSGLLIVIVNHSGVPLVPGVILLAMGLGELGIEGSSVVEKHGGEEAGAGGSIIVLLAAILFLLVNIFLGIVLIHRNGAAGLPAASAIAIGITGLKLVISIRVFKPEAVVRTQMLLYGAGLAVLCSGGIADLMNGLSRLGLAALVLVVSDTLVLIRMGAGFDKSTKSGFRTLLIFLIVILVLYYFYIWLLISI